jgi:NAD(P)-dependent dehydrogenase (short-subunit alcohol dehydrogenase family)
MAEPGTVVIIGGKSVFGMSTAKHYAEKGHPVVVTSRNADSANTLAQEIGGNCTGLSLDLTKPDEIASSLESVQDVQHLVVVPVERDANTVKDYNMAGAINLVTLKLIGYTEVIHALSSKMRERASIVLYGGNAMNRPYPGSLTVTTVNGGISSMIRALAIELAPIRINAIHPAIVGDSPFWADKPAAVLDAFRERTPLGELVSTEDVVHATIFLLENKGITGINLLVDGGTMLV